jgi:signal transduction histidine kinase
VSRRRRLASSVVRLQDQRTTSSTALPAAGLLTVAYALVARLLEVEWAPELSASLGAMVVAPALGVVAPSPELYALAAHDSRLHELEPERALRAQLGALLVLAPVEDASLWLLLADGRLRCLESMGADAPSRRTRQAAADILHDLPPRTAGKRIRIHAAPVAVQGRTRAALVVRSPARHEAVMSYVEAGAEALSETLARQILLDRLAAQQGLLEAAERRVTRVGLDLHDGPLQRMSLVMAEMANLRREFAVYEERLRDQAEAARSIDEQLRQLIAALPPASARRELEALLKRQIRVFRRGAEIPVRLTVRGTSWRTTQSQRIALARVAQEALSNVREHSAATAVEVSLTFGRSAVTLRISDNGRGFDPSAKSGAASPERFGLTAMAEQIQLLDGVFEVESQPGGPTVISAVLQRMDVNSLGHHGEPARTLQRGHG